MMKPLFIRGPSALRLAFFVLASIVLMTTDQMAAPHTNYLKTVRAHLSTLVYPLQYLVDFPVTAGQWLSNAVGTRLQLIVENEQLHEENLRLQAQMQKFIDLQSENQRLRSLLGSSPKTGERVLIAEVLAIDLDPFSRKLLINKGSMHGVFKGQPLIDAQGIMGQVVHVSLFSSSVMLITDPNHELPVQVVDKGLRTIAAGMGAINRLALLYLPNNAPIDVGDLLVTSGFGGIFPPGYPVGVVIEVNPDIAQPYAQVQAIPSATLERNREVLLVWPENLSPPLIDEEIFNDDDTEEQVPTNTTAEEIITPPNIPTEELFPLTPPN